MVLYEQARILLMKTCELEKGLGNKELSIMRDCSSDPPDWTNYASSLRFIYSNVKFSTYCEVCSYDNKITEMQESSHLSKSIELLEKSCSDRFYKQLKLILANLEKKETIDFNLKNFTMYKVIEMEKEIKFLDYSIMDLLLKIDFYKEKAAPKTKNDSVQYNKVLTLIGLIEAEISRLLAGMENCLQKIIVHFDILDDLLVQEVNDKMIKEAKSLEIFSEVSFLIENLKTLTQLERSLSEKNKMQKEIAAEIANEEIINEFNKLSEASLCAYDFLIKIAYGYKTIVEIRDRYKLLLTEWRFLLPLQWVELLQQIEIILNKIEPLYNSLLNETYLKFHEKISLLALRIFDLDKMLNVLENEFKDAMNNAKSKYKSSLYPYRESMQSIITRIDKTEEDINFFNSLVEQYEYIKSVIPEAWKKDFEKASLSLPKIKNKRLDLLNQTKNLYKTLYSNQESPYLAEFSEKMEIIKDTMLKEFNGINNKITYFANNRDELCDEVVQSLRASCDQMNYYVESALHQLISYKSEEYKNHQEIVSGMGINVKFLTEEKSRSLMQRLNNELGIDLEIKKIEATHFDSALILAEANKLYESLKNRIKKIRKLALTAEEKETVKILHENTRSIEKFIEDEKKLMAEKDKLLPGEFLQKLYNFSQKTYLNLNNNNDRLRAIIEEHSPLGNVSDEIVSEILDKLSNLPHAITNKSDLIKKYYELIVREKYTAHMEINPELPGCIFPNEALAKISNDNSGKKLIFDISPDAIRNLYISPNTIQFKASFSGENHYVILPIDAVLAIFAKENIANMYFEFD